MPRPETLLIVDDDADNRDLLSRRLEREGWATRQAESGERALEVVRAGGVNLVLLDLMMPGMGAGNHGAVYRARHVELDRAVAVKVLRTGAPGSVEALHRFRREGIAACRVRHPRAVAVLDFAAAAGVAYLVMELLEGHSLD